MPEPITITQAETTALSDENRQMLADMDAAERGEEAPLLAGKYKSVEELEKGYAELQRKLSGGKPQEPADEAQEARQAPPEAQEGADGEQEAPEAPSARELYGDAIGGRLEEAGIDFSDMNTRWQETGELTDADYGALDEAGFTRDMVDAYLQGLRGQATEATRDAIQQVAQIKAELGGDQAYTAMVDWAKMNLPQEEIDAYNEVVNSSTNFNVVRLAVQGLAAKYQAAQGSREPKLIGGRTSRANDGDRFESIAQVTEAMSDPRYEQDPAYRAKIERKLARSSIM